MLKTNKATNFILFMSKRIEAYSHLSNELAALSQIDHKLVQKIYGMYLIKEAI